MAERWRWRLSQQLQSKQQVGTGGAVVDGAGAILFGELLTIFASEYRDVGVAWPRVSEGLHEKQLARGIVEQVCAADHVGDPLLSIVDDHSQLVGEEPVPALNHEVADATIQLLTEVPLNSIVELETFVWHAYSYGVRPIDALPPPTRTGIDRGVR